MFTYPKQLRQTCITYFKQRCDVDIDHETADLYLERLGAFYSAMESIVKNSTTDFDSRDIRFLDKPDRVEQKTDTLKNQS